MKKLLFLLGLTSMAFASKQEYKESFTYIEMGTFAMPMKDNGVTISYGKRKFYPSNLALDSSLFTAVCFNGDLLVAYKCLGLLYLSPMKFTVLPYIGIGGFGGMISYINASNLRSANLCGNALTVLGCDIDIQGHRQFISATYHLNSNAILLSVGKAF